MIWIYRIIFLPILIISMPYYLRRMLRRGGYRENFNNRFGSLEKLPIKQKKRIWIQAVSVGEINAIKPLIERLWKSHKYEVVLTTTTSTGLQVAKKQFADKCVFLGVFPIDFVTFSQRAWKNIQPDLIIQMEGELWPEHLHQAKKRQVPSILINARLSDRSFKRHFQFKFLSKRLIWNPLTTIICASKQDLERIQKIQEAPERLHISGNLKCDVILDPILTEAEKSERIREIFPSYVEKQSLILLGSSTWPGEEEALCELLNSEELKDIDIKLLIVPRHAERKEEIRKNLEEKNYEFQFRSDKKQIDTPIYIADTTGELKLFTQIADLIFIGKSLSPHTEGQSPIEATLAGKAIVLGPGMSNFKDISQNMLENQAAKRATDKSDMQALLSQLLVDNEQRAQLAQNARNWISTQKGAVQKTTSIVEDEL